MDMEQGAMRPEHEVNPARWNELKHEFAARHLIDEHRKALIAAIPLDMARARISDDTGLAALRAEPKSHNQLATAVRYTLQLLAERAEGNTVEVRIPPFGAVQCIPGPRHTRGTPPNVVEMNAETWLALATGMQSWASAMQSGRVAASGSRADLSDVLPVVPATMDS